MKRIVVATDGSPSAEGALRWALGEARLREVPVTVLHAWLAPLMAALPEPWAVGTPTFGPSDEQVYDGLRSAARAILDAAVEEARRLEPGLDVRGELVEAHPASALLEAAKDADLLVVGTRGHGGFAGLLLGSVSSQCVHHAPCPVVVVPPERTES
jgi:nucleotide-binding universal stress UspA family protein